MQKTIYKCDECKKEIGEKPHISLVMNNSVNGIALPPNHPKGQSHWYVQRIHGFLHFCSAEHLAKWFEKEIAKYAVLPVKKKK